MPAYNTTQLDGLGTGAQNAFNAKRLIGARAPAPGGSPYGGSSGGAPLNYNSGMFGGMGYGAQVPGMVNSSAMTATGVAPPVSNSNSWTPQGFMELYGRAPVAAVSKQPSDGIELPPPTRTPEAQAIYDLREANRAKEAKARSAQLTSGPFRNGSPFQGGF